MNAVITNADMILDVRIDGLMHLFVDLKDVKAIHSFIDEKSDIANIKWMMYYINFHLASGQIVKCEYNRKDLWEQILKGL